jgi:hypothetical protein
MVSAPNDQKTRLINYDFILPNIAKREWRKYDFYFLGILQYVILESDKIV